MQLIDIALLLLSRRDFAKALKAFNYLTLLTPTAHDDYQAYISLCRANSLNSAGEDVTRHQPELNLLLWVDGDVSLNEEALLTLQQIEPFLNKLILAGSDNTLALQDLFKTITSKVPKLIIEVPPYPVDSISDFVIKQLVDRSPSQPETLYASYELAKFKSSQHLMALSLKQLYTDAMVCEQALVIEVGDKKQCSVADFSQGAVFSSQYFASDFYKHYHALNLLNVPAYLIISWHHHLNGVKVEANSQCLGDDVHFSVELLENWFLHRYQENVASFDSLVFKSDKDSNQ